MKEILVVVDMVNGFVNFGALADKNINKITPNIEKLIKRAKQKGIKIVAFKDCHSLGDEEFSVYPVHCLEHSLESELIPELKKYESEMTIIKKNTTNGFKTIFSDLVKRIDFDKVHVVGCCTDICVKDFVLSYLNFIRENNKQTKIFVYEDACYTFDSNEHSAQTMHKKSLEIMREKGAKIVSVNFENEIERI